MDEGAVTDLVTDPNIEVATDLGVMHEGSTFSVRRQVPRGDVLQTLDDGLWTHRVQNVQKNTQQWSLPWALWRPAIH